MKMRAVNVDRVKEFYQRYPDRFLEDILGVELHLYQKMYLRLAARSGMTQTLTRRGRKRR